MVAVRLKTLGEFVLTYDGRRLPPPPTKKARALVAYLVMHRSTDVAREQLLELFWRDFDPQRARDNLNATLWSVRRMFRKADLDPDDVMRADRTIIHWHAAVDFDVDRLFELSTRADQIAAQEALSLYGGEFLEGDFDDWPVAERERISLAYETLLSRASKDSGGVAAAEQLIGRNPYDEAAYATLIESQLQGGQTLAAAILVERCRRALDEVGTKPSGEFEERFGELRRPPEDHQSELRIPFVARDRELRFLAERFGQCAMGKGSVTLVAGDAGIGKSTLLAHAGRIGLKHASHLVEIGCNGNEREELRKAALAIAAFSEPFIFVIDDAQNLAADALSLFVDLVDSGFERHCFVVATRPEGLGSLRQSLERYAPFELNLASLSRADVEGALRQAAGSDLSEVSAKLFERTGGHPLYVVRLLEALVENGALERRQRVWNVTEKFDESLPLPGSVRAFIEARLHARGNLAATVAGALAIEPLAMAVDLGAVLGLDEETLLDALDDLLALGLIRQPQAGPQFEFSHDLIGEVAGAQLNAGRAVRIHRRFAELLRLARDRDAPARIATHLLAARDVLGAGQAFVGVAEGALESRAFRDCAAACERATNALRQLERSPERDTLLATLHRVRSRARLALGKARAAWEDADQAVSLERGAGSGASLARALIARGQSNQWAGDWELAANDFQEAASAARDHDDSDLLRASLTELSAIARVRGDKESALALAREAYERAVAAADWHVARRAVGESMLTCCAWWDIENALRLSATSLELAQRCGETEQANHYNLVAVLSYVRERYVDAKRELAQAFQVDDRASPPTIFFNQLLSAIVALAEARWNDALEIATGLQARIAGESLPLQQATLAAVRVEALLSRGAPDDMEDAVATFGAIDDRSQTIFPWNIDVAITRARVAARRAGIGSTDSLRDALNAAEERAHEIPFDADRAYAQVELACRDAGNDRLATRAALQRAHYAGLRRSAAGGVRPTISVPIFPNARVIEAMPRTSS